MYRSATFRIFLPILLLLLSETLSAQNQTVGDLRRLELKDLKALAIDPAQQTLSLTYDVPFSKAPSPFIAACIHLPASTNGSASIRYSVDGQQWSDWEICKPDPHVSDEAVSISVPLFLDKSAQKVQIRLQGEAAKAFQNDDKNAQLLLFNPEMPAVNELAKPVHSPTKERGNNCGTPEIQTRAMWNAPTLPATCQTRTNVTHLIVHHSATANTSANWAATVLSIWRFHTTSSGFCDVGYNYLIDPNGVIYEGRIAGEALNIQGAHFCGTNSNTMGVCLLGDYTSVQPTEATLNSLVQLLAWRSTNLGIDVIGTLFHPSSGLTLNRISGHRDGCATSCPGDMNYPLLPQVRERVKNCTNPVSAKDAASVVDRFNITPNPTDGLFSIQLELRQPQPVRIHVYNNLGQLVHNTDATQPTDLFRTDIDLSGQTAGFYYVRAWAGDREVSKRLIVH
jgi:N-acetylmuramoyl-L-alanine amidase/Secretion system C-terminal sorting domain